MKRIVCIIALVFAMVPFLSAQDQSKDQSKSAQDQSTGTDMSGTICDQKCVKQEADKASWDLSCTEKSGEAAFIDDEGKVWKVANPAMCKGKMGKKVKANVKKTEDPGTLWLNSLSLHG